MPIQEIQQRHAVRRWIDEDPGPGIPLVGPEQKHSIVLGEEGAKDGAVEDEWAGEERDEGIALFVFVEHGRRHADAEEPPGAKATGEPTRGPELGRLEDDFVSPLRIWVAESGPEVDSAAVPIGMICAETQTGERVRGEVTFLRVEFFPR